MIEHCVSSYQKRQKELQYRVYVTDMLKNIIDINTGGKADVPRFADLMEEHHDNNKPEETADDVIARITQNLTDMGN